MIRVKRGTEPTALARARDKKLKSAVAAHASHGPGSKELAAALTGYDSPGVKTALFLAQNKECVWCERRRDLSSSPIEHYRPKDGAWRHRRDAAAKHVDRGHYWWLTWSWSNLYFACARCNDKGHKANFFRLAPGTSALAAPASTASHPLAQTYFNLAAETPLLVDPGSEDPMDHIEWLPVDRTQPRDLWTWSPKGRTQKGDETIFDLKLTELADEVGDAIRTGVLRGIEEVEDLLKDGKLVRARKRWNTLLHDELFPEASLTAAKWYALEAWMPAATRTRHGLTHPSRP